MDQSDSQDFEFDISDLEVEDSGSSAPRAGENVSNDQAAPDAPIEEEVADNEVVSEDSQTVGSDAPDDDLAGFDLGGIPDVSGGNSVTIDSDAVADSSVAPAKNEAVSESSTEVVTDKVSQIEPEAQEPPEVSPSMRQLGNDDLGANVFEEIDDSSDTDSFSDVLDGLMDEVSEFEVGTEVDDVDAENAEAARNGLPDPFKLDDPDDSVTAQSGVNPKPFEPSEDDPLGESLEIESEPIAKVVPQEVEQVSAPESVAEPAAEQPEPVAATPVEPVMEQPSPSQPVAPIVEEPKREIPPDFEIPADDGVAAASEALKVEPPAPLEEEPAVGSGTENVLVDASAEESLTESSAPEIPVEAAPAEPVAASDPLPAEPVTEAKAPEAKVVPEVAEDQVEEAAAIEGSSEIVDVEEPVEEVAIEEATELAEETAPESTASDTKENVLFDASEIEEIDENVDSESVEELPEPMTDVEDAVATEEPEEDVIAETSAELEKEIPSEISVSDSQEKEDVADDVDLESIEEQVEEVVEEVTEENVNVESSEESADEAIVEESSEAEEETASEVNSSDSEESALFDETEVEEVVNEVDLQAIEDQLETEDSVEEEVSELVTESEELIEEPTSPEAIAEDSSNEETSADDEDADAADLLESVEAMFEEEEEEVIEEAEAPAAAVPELEILDEEEDEPEIELEAPAANEIPGLTEVPEEEEEALQGVASGLTEVEEEEEVTEAMPSAEDLLMSAASLLNGDDGPAAAASSLLEEEEDEEEGLAAMPSPADLMSEASGTGLSEVEEEEEEEFVSMPDPSALMSAAETTAPEGLAILEDEEEEEELAVIDEIEAPDEELEKPEFSGNIADNAGGLPPPPPAPVEIIDDDPMEEEVEEILPDVPISAPEPVAENDSGIEDPFANDSLLEGLDSDLDESVDDLSSDSDELDEPKEGEEVPEDEEGKPVEQKKVAEVIEMPQPSLLWRITHSMTIAAGLVFIGLGWISFTWKQEIREYMEGRDLDGSGLLTQIRQVGEHALDGFNEDGLYRMQWLDTDIRRVANNEIRLHSIVGAQLQENLYEPVFASVLEDKFGYNENAYIDAMEFAHANFPEKIGSSPVRPWSTLYRLSSSKDEILPLKIVYRVVREDENTEWDLAGMKVSGYKSDLEWATGRPRHDFDERAKDVDSEEFAEMVLKYKVASARFVANMNTLKKSLEAEEAMLAMENRQRRERVVMSLSQGAFFSGIAILGEDSDASQGVTMVVTEVRQDVGLLKGVFKVSGGEGVSSSKHFIGRIDFKKSHDGLDNGVLNLTTVAFEKDLTSGEVGEAIPFFSPSTISHMQLKTDGFRLEGDASDIALRMTRHM